MTLDESAGVIYSRLQSKKNKTMLTALHAGWPGAPCAASRKDCTHLGRCCYVRHSITVLKSKVKCSIIIVSENLLTSWPIWAPHAVI